MNKRKLVLFGVPIGLAIMLTLLLGNPIIGIIFAFLAYTYLNSIAMYRDLKDMIDKIEKKEDGKQ